jgi:uroporphyrin-III C-methyltransferase/precorrin-2 dehydrogenase/sirohydrochlorin ferrochelatase
VLAPQLHPDLAGLAQTEQITWLAQRVPEDDSALRALLRGHFYTIAATNDNALHERLRYAAFAENRPLNVVDQRQLCSAISPAIIDRSPIIVAISSGGVSPVLARQIREKLEALLPRSLGVLARLAERFREKSKAVLPNEQQRRRFLDALLRGPTAHALESGQHKQAERHAEQCLSTATKSEQRGRVSLVGAGPGDPELISLKALRIMQQADVIVYDGLVDEALVDLARRDAERVPVAKRGGRLSADQDDINQRLIHHARQGQYVVRLKGGDPFVFGRGGEELLALRQAGIDYDVVPGITAANASAAYAGLPLTHRHHAQSVRLVTAHCRDNIDALDWPALAADRQTLAFYMAVRQLAHVEQQLLAHGRDANTPVALIENASRQSQRVLLTRLRGMQQWAQSRALTSPSMVIVGEVAAMAAQLHWFGPEPDIDPAAGDWQRSPSPAAVKMPGFSHSEAQPDGKLKRPIHRQTQLPAQL